MDYYFTEWLLKTRLGEARALAEQLALLEALCPPRQPARRALGLALIWLGRWVLGELPQRGEARDLAAHTGSQP